MSCFAAPCKREEFEKTTVKIKREMMTEAMKVRRSDVESPMEGPIPLCSSFCSMYSRW